MTSLHAAIAVLAAAFWSSWCAFALSMVRADARFIMVCSKVLIGAAQCLVIHPGWSRIAR
jgi:undecaprenyl pyrophosphate phosphatase UppP